MRCPRSVTQPQQNQPTIALSGRIPGCKPEKAKPRSRKTRLCWTLKVGGAVRVVNLSNWRLIVRKLTRWKFNLLHLDGSSRTWLDPLSFEATLVLIIGDTKSGLYTPLIQWHLVKEGGEGGGSGESGEGGGRNYSSIFLISPISLN